MGLPFIPLASSATQRFVLAAALFSSLAINAQQSAPLAWSRIDEACPAFLQAAREIVFYREAETELVDIGGVRFDRVGRVEGEGIAFEFEAPPFAQDGWTFRLTSGRCVALGSTGEAKALTRENAVLFRERVARLRKADASLAAMQRAVTAQNRAEAVAVVEAACEERRGALGANHALVAGCEIQHATRSLFHARYDEGLRLASNAHATFSSIAPGERGVEALAARNAQAQAFFYLSRPAEMHAAALEAFEGRRRLLGASHPDTILSQGAVAIALRRLGRLDDSIPIYEEVARRQTEIHGATGIDALRAKSNLSSALQQRGDWDRVVALQSEVYEARRSTLGETHEATLNSTHDLASALWDAGRAHEALSLAESALPLFPAHLGDEHAQTMRIKSLLGVIYLDLGRDDESLPLFRDVYAVNQRTFGDGHRSTALAARNLAHSLVNLGRAEESVALLEAALAQMPTGLQRDTATERDLHQLRAYSLLRSGQPDRALEAFESVLEARALSPEQVRRATPDQLWESTGWAEAQFEMGRHDPAIDAMDSIHRGSRERFGPDHALTLDAMASLASMLAAAGRSGPALELLAEFVERNERRMREGLVASAVNRGRLSQGVRERPHAAGYRTYVRLLASKDALRALEVAELTKARSLAETLARPGADSAPLQLARLQFARAEERVAASEIGSTSYLKAVGDRSKAEDQLRAAIGPAVRRAAPPDLRETLRRTLPPGTILMHFVVSGDRVVAITSNHLAQVRARDLGTIPGLAESVEAFRRVLISPAPASERIWALPNGGFRWSLSQPPGSTRLTDAGRIGRDLSKRLVDPLAADLGSARTWIISPDGPLAFLPFEALHLGKQTVLEARNVRYAPSLSSLAVMPAMVSSGTRQEFLGVGVSRFDDAWRNLPQAQAEVRAIGELFPASQRRLLEGNAATETRMRELDTSGELRRYRYVHFATHAFLSGRGASLSGVVLSGSEVGKNDGIITAAEWPTYRLRSDLVVLSACDTGLGRLVAGEGVVGLPHALLSAGSRAVLLTLWSVSDSSAADFMPRFYRRLRSGKSPAEALRETKLEFARSKGPWSAPRHWAPYVLYGAS